MFNLLFDLDGTIIDSSIGITNSLNFCLSQLGYNTRTPTELSWVIGPPIRDSLSILLGQENQSILDKAVEIFRYQYKENGLHQHTIYDGILSQLDSLRSGGNELYIATSKPEPFAQAILSKIGIDKTFNAIYGSTLEGKLNNKSSLIKHIIDNESLDAKNTIMIGDRKHDIVGANDNNIKSIGALWGFGTKEELILAGATTLVEKPTLLTQALSQFNKSI